MYGALQNLKRDLGFTLIELMISVAIVAVLTAVALPSYQNYVKRGKRAAAQAQMLDISSRQQQYFLDKRVYASKEELEAAGYALPREVASNYTYAITVPSTGMPTFTIEFTPTGNQASDGALTLNSAGVKMPAAKW